MTRSDLVTALVVGAAGVFILAALVLLLRRAAYAVGTDEARRTARLASVVLLVWAGAAVTLAARAGLSFPLFLGAALVPIALGGAALLSRRMSVLLAHASLPALVAV